MTRTIFRRFVATLIVLWGVTSISFLLLHITPGDPTYVILGDMASDESRQALRHELGLDRPLPEQYFAFMGRLASGDLGMSYMTQRRVVDDLKAYLPSTILLGFCAMCFAICLGIPLGVAAAVNRNSFIDRAISFFSLFGISIPGFWLAPILIIVFSIKLDLLPVSGQAGFTSIILPTMSLGLGLSAALIRMTRTSFLETMKEDYVVVARAKGLDEWTVAFKHILRNAMTPITTLLSFQFGAVLTGVVITETIFDWPGLGFLFYSALKARNYPMVQGCVLTVAVIYVIVNILTDLAYMAVNPRLRSS
jgi:peptide/nickel transport system permease protein